MDFGAEELLEQAQERFGKNQLRLRMRGAPTESLADDELLDIAESVVGRAQVAAAASVGWPLPGQPTGGPPYREKWPADFLQRALDLFKYRTGAGLEEMSEHERRMGTAAERYFDEVQKGVVGVGIGGTTDVGPASPSMARERGGRSNVSGVPDQENSFDVLEWFGSASVL
ncbi:MAG: hypothetical protein M3547_00140 [Acidobacteriota bacterium]|nr:hypothetical protein [Acidobacteriota bacterium]